jgi:hypothetical protein
MPDRFCQSTSLCPRSFHETPRQAVAALRHVQVFALDQILLVSVVYTSSMKSAFSGPVRRGLSAGCMLLPLWSAGWSVSTDAFSDWLRAEAAGGVQTSNPPSSPSAHHAPKVTCNGGCHALTQFLGLAWGAFAIPRDGVACVRFPEEPQTLRSTFSDRPYHPPRHISLSLEG